MRMFMTVIVEIVIIMNTEDYNEYLMNNLLRLNTWQRVVLVKYIELNELMDPSLTNEEKEREIR